MVSWHHVEGNQDKNVTPLALDTSSSPKTVYQRKNIVWVEAVSNDNPMMAKSAHWEYDEQEFTLDEYANYNSPTTQAVMQQISDIQMNNELNVTTAQEERQLIAQAQSDLELAIAQMEV